MSPSWPPGGLDPLIESMQEAYLPSIPEYDIHGLLTEPRLGRRALVSSFGAESVVLLHYVTAIDPTIEVVFIDTGRHFPETLAYRDAVTERLGLRLINVGPDPAMIAQEDADSLLFQRDSNMCCTLRKVFPLQDALTGFQSWISGRKRFQNATRAAIPMIERDGEKIKLNPMAMWGKAQIEDYIARHDLPPHPLEAQGYPSIGCAPCTRPVRQGEDARAGRWANEPNKSECGIHLGPDGRFVRIPSGN